MGDAEVLKERLGRLIGPCFQGIPYKDVFEALDMLEAQYEGRIEALGDEADEAYRRGLAGLPNQKGL